MTLRPFRAIAGFDAHGERGINLAAPIVDTDFAQKLWTEEQIAAQSRLRGTYLPDSDGQETPAPDLTALTPGVDVLTADYWITEISGRSATGPFARTELNADDRLVARVSPGGVISVTLNPSAPTGLLPNEVYRFEPTDPTYPGRGSGLGILLFVNATGDVFANSISNFGYDYQVGEVINGTIPNNYINAIAPTPGITPGTFQLLPNTTYYNALITGGTGSGARLNIRTGATGAEISDVYILSRGINYTAGDTLTIEVEGQIVGTISVTAVYSGSDIPCQVTIDVIGLATGWDLIRGPGLTRAQANQDYLRLDAGNSPNRDISWNNQGLKDLADPLAPQDAVNLRTLRRGAGSTNVQVNQTAHGFSLGQAIYRDAAGLWQLAQANSATTLKAAIVGSVVDANNFVAVYNGYVEWPAHGLTVGSLYYLDAATPGAVTTTPPIGTTEFAQGCFQVEDAEHITVIETAATTSAGVGAPIANVPVIAGGGGGFTLIQSTDIFPTAGTWLRVGTLVGHRLVELDMRTVVQGSGSGSLRVVVGAGFSTNGKCQIQGQSDNQYIDSIRLVSLGGGNHAIDVRTQRTNVELSSVVVVGYSAPNAFAFEPAIAEAPISTPHTQFDFSRTVSFGVFTGTAAQDLTVQNNGDLSIGGDTYQTGTTQVFFGNGLRQMLNLNGVNWGIGIQTSTQYSRVSTSGQWKWYRGGSHDDAAGNAGGGITAMTLDGNSDLTVGRRVLNAAARTNPGDRELIERGYLDQQLPTPFPMQERSFSSGSSGANNYVEAGSFNSGSMNNAIGWITTIYTGGSSAHVQKFFFNGYAGSNLYGWYMTVGFNVRRNGVFDRVNLRAASSNIDVLSRLTVRKRNNSNVTVRVGVQRAERWNWNLGAAGTQHGTSAPGSGPSAEATIASPFMRESSSGVWGFHSEGWFDGIDESGQIIRGGYYLDPVDSMGVVDFAALQAEDPDVQPGFPVLRRRVNKANAQRLLWSLQAWLKEWNFEAMLTGDVFTPTAEMVAGIRFLQRIIRNPPTDRFIGPETYADHNINMALHMFDLSQPTLKLDWDLEVDWDEHDDKLTWEHRRALEG